MNITVTEKLKLKDVSPETDAAFSELCDIFAKACDEVSVYAFENNLMLNRRELNDALYYGIRECFDLKAQLTQSVIRSVVSRYKSENTKLKDEPYRYNDKDGKNYSFKRNIDWIMKPIRFLNPQADLVRNRDFSFLDNMSAVSVATLTGRVKLHYSIRKKSRLFNRSWTIGGAKLLKKNGEWYLYVSMTKETPEPELSNIKEVVGIDRGLVNLITTRDSGNTSYVSGSDAGKTRDKHDRVRASLQSKGTKGAKRVLKRISGRENRWMEDENHVLSKALVGKHGKNTLFVLEDLSGVSFDDDNLSDKDKETRHKLRSWAFYSFEQKLMYKAAQDHSLAIKVNPAYTSQRCPVCGTIDKKARDLKKHEYICRSCNNKFNDDEVAAYNLRTLGLMYLAGNEDPEFTKKP